VLVNVNSAITFPPDGARFSFARGTVTRDVAPISDLR
jgi:hypothetical protein